MSFPVISASEIPNTSSRITKTHPLRLAIYQLSLGEAIEVAYDTHDPEHGYKPTTISQVAGAMTAKSETLRFTVKKKADNTGCYVIATEKPAPGTEKKRGRKPKPKAA